MRNRRILEIRSFLIIWCTLILIGCIGGFESTTTPSKSFYKKLEDTYSQNLWAEGFSQEKITAILYQSRRNAQIAVAVASWTSDITPYSTATMKTYLIAFSKGSVKALTAPEINAPDSDSKIDALERITSALSSTLKLYLVDVEFTAEEEFSFWKDYSQLLTTEAILTSNVAASSGAQLALDVGAQLSATILKSDLSANYLEGISLALAQGLAESIYDYRTDTNSTEKCQTLQAVGKGTIKGISLAESLNTSSTEVAIKNIFLGLTKGAAKTLTFSDLLSCADEMTNAAINGPAFFFNATDTEKTSFSAKALHGHVIGINYFKQFQWSDYISLIEDICENVGRSINLNLISASEYQAATEAYLESILDAAASTGVANSDLLSYLPSIRAATDTGLTVGGFLTVDTSTMLLAYTPSCLDCDPPALPVFSYSANLTATDGIAIALVQPLSTGGLIAKCSSAPALPAGLILSPGCEISGTPTSGPLPLTTFTISGENATGVVTSTIDIEVL